MIVRVKANRNMNRSWYEGDHRHRNIIFIRNLSTLFEIEKIAMSRGRYRRRREIDACVVASNRSCQRKAVQHRARECPSQSVEQGRRRSIKSNLVKLRRSFESSERSSIERPMMKYRQKRSRRRRHRQVTAISLSSSSSSKSDIIVISQVTAWGK